MAVAVWGHAAAAERPSLLVVGLRNQVDDKDWDDRRLGMGVRGRLVQMFHDSGAFTMREERELAAGVREALGGYWLRERPAALLADLPRLHREVGVDWVAHGSLDDVGVTQDQVSGLVSGRRWAYDVAVKLCLHGAAGRELCRDGAGRSATLVYGVVFEYRGQDVAFDQEGPARAVELALVDAFNRLLPAWDAAGGKAP